MMASQRDMLRAAAKLPPMSDEEVGRHMKAISARVQDVAAARKAMFAEWLAQAVKEG